MNTVFDGLTPDYKTLQTIVERIVLQEYAYNHLEEIKSLGGTTCFQEKKLWVLEEVLLNDKRLEDFDFSSDYLLNIIEEYIIIPRDNKIFRQ